MIDVVVEDDRWEAIGFVSLATRAVSASLAHLGVESHGELAVLACDDARISTLNSEFRSEAAPTNVLSWPSAERASPVAGIAPLPPEPDEDLGDLALAYETTAREAAAGGIPLENHVLHLLVHGTLHLLGYDHERNADGDLMESVEAAILATLGVPDPYTVAGAGDRNTGKD